MQPAGLETLASRLADAPESTRVWFERRRERVRRGTTEAPAEVRDRSLSGGVVTEGDRDHGFTPGEPASSGSFPTRIRKLASEWSEAFFGSPPVELGVDPEWVGPPWADPACDLLFERRTRQEVWVADRRGLRHDVREGCHQRFEHDGQVFDRVFDPARHPKSWPERPTPATESLDPGPIDAVYAPGAAGVVLHELIGHALEGTDGRALAEATTGTPGAFTVVEDPRRGRVAWRLDDEGSESGAVPLVVTGRVTGGLHDRRTARRFGAEPTGSARRSTFREPVRPRMGCTYLAAGSRPPESIVENLERGVYIERIESGWFDRTRLRARLRVTRASRIEHGTTGVGLRPFSIETTAREWWSHLDAVADDLAFDTTVGSCHRFGQPLAVSVGAPTCRQRSLTVVR